MIADSHAEILTILAAHPAGLKTAEIVSIADDNPKSQVVGNSEASKMIYSMRGSSLVTSWIDGGKNKHKITPKGLNELKEFNDAKTPTIQPTPEISTVSPMDLYDKPQTGMQADTVLAEPHQNINMAVDQDKKSMEIQELHTIQTQTPNELLQTAEIPQPSMMYDPFKDIYNQLQKASDMVEKLPRPKPRPVIKQSKEKIMMLNLVKNHYELINQDVGELFSDMINDYKNLEQCA